MKFKVLLSTEDGEVLGEYEIEISKEEPEGDVHHLTTDEALSAGMVDSVALDLGREIMSDVSAIYRQRKEKAE